jgi:hypothetical protein
LDAPHLISGNRASCPDSYVNPIDARYNQITANGGFFTNLFSFLNPTPLAIQTPPELQPYGWSIADLWCAPLITGLYALLTHAQPFWADVHALIAGASGSASLKPTVQPVDPETARAVCAILLVILFVGRAAMNFRLWRSFENFQIKVGAESAKASTFHVSMEKEPFNHLVAERKAKIQ